MVEGRLAPAGLHRGRQRHLRDGRAHDQKVATVSGFIFEAMKFGELWPSYFANFTPTFRLFLLSEV